MAYKHIQTELKEGVATLTLNRPPLNVLNIEMMEEINTYFETLNEKGLEAPGHSGRREGIFGRRGRRRTSGRSGL